MMVEIDPYYDMADVNRPFMMNHAADYLWRAEHRQWLWQHRLDQRDCCHYCGCGFASQTMDALLRPTLDHVVPLARGGEDIFENTVAACWLCNTAKRDMMPDEAFLLLRHARVALVNDMEAKSRRQKNRRKRQRKAKNRQLRLEKERAVDRVIAPGATPLNSAQ